MGDNGKKLLKIADAKAAIYQQWHTLFGLFFPGLPLYLSGSIINMIQAII